MYEDVWKMRERKFGRVLLRIKHVGDYDPDLSYLGEFSNYREPKNKDQKLVHLTSQTVLDHHGIWRDKKGRIQQVPECCFHNGEYSCTFHDNGHEKIAYALQDSNRLEAINCGNIGFFGIVVEVLINGREIGCDSVWGYESDGDARHIRNEEFNITKEAVADARKWLKSLKKNV